MGGQICDGAPVMLLVSEERDLGEGLFDSPCPISLISCAVGIPSIYFTSG
jgi:hypothetical protein